MSASIITLVWGRARRAVSGRIPGPGRVLVEAFDTALVELRVGDRAALFAHTCFAERAVMLQLPCVVLALNYVLLGRPI